MFVIVTIDVNLSFGKYAKNKKGAFSQYKRLMNNRKRSGGDTPSNSNESHNQKILHVN